MLNQGKTPFQRFLAVLCAGAMLCSMMPVQVFAEDLETGKKQTSVVTDPVPETSPANTPTASQPEQLEQPEVQPAPVMPLADPVNSITLNPQDLTLTAGSQETAVLEATVDPATATVPVVWESSASDIVTVEPAPNDNRKANVSMLKVGEATIIATCGDQSATCTVKAVAGPATSVTIDPTTVPQTVYPADGNTFQLTATTEPALCSDKVAWAVSSADGSFLDGVVTIDENGVVTIGDLAQDSYQVTVTATAGQYSDDVTFTVAKKEDTITFTSGDTMVYGSSMQLQATSASGSAVSYALVDDGSNTAGAILAGETVKVTSKGTFTVEASTAGNGWYLAGTASMPVTVNAKTLTPVFDGSVLITKTSDGTDILSGDNATALTGAIRLNPEEIVSGDDVSLQVNLDNVKYASSVVGPTTIDLSQAVLTLDGASMGNYELANFDQSINATINPVAPGRGQDQLEAGRRETEITVNRETLATFAQGVRGANYITYWYGVNGVPVTLGADCDLVAVGGNGVPGSTLVKEVDSVKYFSAASGTAFYVARNGIYYGPYTLTFTQDTTAPQIVLSKVEPHKADGSEPAVDNEKPIFGTSVEYTIAVNDTESGTDTNSVYYLIADVGSSAPAYDDPNWVQVTPQWFQQNYIFTVQAPKTGVLYVKAGDQVGNLGDQKFHTLVLESDAPTLTVTTDQNTLANGGAMTNSQEDYDLSILASDPGTDQNQDGTIDNQQSGIQKITYTISWEDRILGIFHSTGSKEGTIYDVQTLPSSVDELKNYLEHTESVSLIDLLQKDENDPEKEYNGTYTLTLNAYDFCGNSTEFTYDFELDSAKPTVTVTMNGGNALDNTYYYNAGNCGLTVHFADENLAGSTCEATLVGGANPSSKSVTAEDMTCDITFTADEVKELGDGIVTLTIKVTDTVGNEQTAFAETDNVGMALNGNRTVASFVLDTTAPVLKSVGMTDGGNYYESDGIYYNEDFSVVLTVEEANYMKAGVQNSSSRTNDGPDVVMTAPEEADNGTAAIQLGVSGTAENAIYNLGISLQDKAGNGMVLSTDSNDTFEGASAVTVANGQATLNTKFVLDTVSPKLTSVTSTPEGNAYENDGVYHTGAFDVAFTFADANYDSQKVVVNTTVTPTGDDPEGTVNVADDLTSSTKTVSVSNVGADGSTIRAAHTAYAISLTATDKAGNKLESGSESLTVENGGVTLPEHIMDNVAPVMTIEYTTYTGPDRYDGVAYYNTDLGATFTVNDASLDAYELKYSLSQQDTQEQKETEVRFVQETDANRFGTSYTLNKTIAAESDHSADGTYVYTVEGKDKAGNALVVASESYQNGVQVFDPKEGTKATPYTGAANAIDTVAPTATMSYTQLNKSNMYQLDDGLYSYYNKDFEAVFTFKDTYGDGTRSYNLDQNQLHYVQYKNGDAENKEDLIVGEATDQPEVKVSYPVAARPDVQNEDYTFAAYGTDKAGNALMVYEPDIDGNLQLVGDSATSAYQSTYHKVLDTAAPTYTLTLSELGNDPKIAVDDNNRAYHNSNITAIFDVEDTNLDDGKVKTAVIGNTDATNYETADVTWQDLPLAQGNAVDNAMSLSRTADRDGVYRFEIVGEDRAGNRLVPAADEAGKQEYLKAVPVGEGQFWTYLKVRDTQAPVLTVNLNDGADFYTAILGEASEPVNTYYSVTQNLPYRSATDATGTLTKSDCSPTSVVYSISSTTQSQSLDNSPYNYDALSLSFNGEQIFSIETLSIADRAGNKSTMPAKTNKIYLDATAPDVDELAPTVAIAAHQSGEGRSTAGTDLFNTGVTVRATVTDPGEGVRSSGLYQVYYKVLVNGDDWTDRVGVSGKGVVGQAGILGYGTGGSEFVSDGSDQPITSQDVIDFSFDAETFNYNDVKIYVWAEDNAGNELTEAQASHYYFGIDVTTPTIEVSYDNNNAQNEKYFKEDRVATIVVTERNFDPSNTNITTESTNISGWTYAAGALPNGDDDTWTCTVSYTEDGDYTFDVTTTDLVGHKAEEADYGDSVAPKEFTIDKTAPVIQISFNNNDVRNGKFYDAARTATISIEEHNFSADGATVSTTANIQEGSVAAPAASGWSSNGDTNTATVPFTNDGNYTMNVEFVDLAGNEAEPEDVDEFVVDTTAPELEISGVEDHMAYNGDVTPVITYHDINYDASSALVAIQGVKHPAGENLNGTRTEDAFGGSFVCDNIEAVKENDDVYTATGSVSDMAGNETEVSVIFSVNRFGSTYMIGEETQPLLDDYYTNTPQALHVIEINVDGQVSNRVTTSLNGEVTTLQEGTDYTVTESVPGWHQYDYNIAAGNFTTEGAYDVTLSSEDEAGNTSSNRAVKEDGGATSDLAITFVVDMTPPVNVITGVDNDEQYIDVERTIVVNYDDNIGMAGMTLYVNEEKVAEYSGDELQNAAGAIQYTAKAADRWQSFKVVSTDLAGNTSEESTVRYLLTDNLLVQYFNNKPIFYGSLAILAALIVLIVVLVKRKKQQPVNKV